MNLLARLDSTTAETILDIFEKMVNNGKTVVLVTHDASASATSHPRDGK
jgi:ABC-type lipoprotein export system ATPase subunit